LVNLALPESIKSIGDAVFSECEELNTITLPKSLKHIGNHVFEGCTGLTSIKLPKSLISIGDLTFEGCTGLTEIIADENNPAFCSVEGVVFDKTMKTLIIFPEGKKGRYSVPDGVIKIIPRAFGNCRELTSIFFPKSLLGIYSFGFNGEQLADITVSELNPCFYSIDGVLLDKKSKTLLAYPKNKDKTDYEVPDGILRIADQAFCGCKRLVNIAFPMNLQYAGKYVFKDCLNLETITVSRKTKFGRKAFWGFKGQLIYRD
jgi:RNase P/RNase MRP subunit p29